MPPNRGSSRDSALKATIGRYEVQRIIGSGSMGRVLLAHDPVLGRDVAIKLMRDDLRIPEDVRQGLVVRMRHEARAAARVPHPNLVTLHDMGEDPELGLYLVFEFVEGPTLKQRLLDGHLPPRKAARLARELGEAVTFAHNAGILHRDIKPENVILSVTGGKLADFGIAKIPDSTLTHAGGLMGTPAYSAPETFKSGKFSPESDQFSLAATLYEAISGKRAFPGDEAVAVASRIASGPPDRFAEEAGLPPEVDEVLARAMAPEPAARFPSCEGFGRALSIALGASHRRESDAPGADPLGEAPTLLEPPGKNVEPARRPERKSGQIALGALAVLITAGLVVRTALRSAETSPAEALEQPPEASASASATPAPPPKAKPPGTGGKPRSPRSTSSVDSPAEPGGGAGGQAAEAEAPRDAGAPLAPDGGAPATSAPSADASAPSAAGAGADADPGGKTDAGATLH